MNTTYDGNFNEAVPIRPVRVVYPYSDFRALVLYEQDYVVRADKYTATRLGVKHHIHTDAVLAEEVNQQPIGGGLVQFTRVFCTVPEQLHEEPLVTGYTYPAKKLDYLFYGYNTNTLRLRKAFTRRVTGRIIHSYHQVDEEFLTQRLKLNQNVLYNGFIATVEEIDEEENNVTITYNNRNYEEQRITVSSFMVKGIGEDSDLTNFKGLPISSPFRITKQQSYHIVEGSDGTEYILPSVVWSDGAGGFVQKSKTVTVQSLTQYTTPSIDDYEKYAAIQIDETEIEQVRGTIYRCTNSFVPAL